MLSAIASVDVIEQLLEPVTALVDEARVHFETEQVHITVVDPANVAMVDTTLDAAAFESYEADGETLGLNLGQFTDVLGLADSGDLVHLDLDAQTRKLDIEIGSVTDYTQALINPQSIRSEPDQPDMGLPNAVVLEGGDLEHAVAAAQLASDHLSVASHGAREEIQFIAEGDTDDVRTAYGPDETIDIDAAAEVGSLVSLDYVADVVEPIPSAAEVRVEWGDEFPIVVNYEHSEGRGHVHNTIAPRVRGDN